MSDENSNLDSILNLTKELVQTPSRAYEDNPENIINVVSNWAKENKLSFTKLKDENGKELGGYFHYSSGKPGKTICLNACIDTCQYGDLKTWTNDPTSAKQENGYMYGRGVADSKIAVSIFCHIFNTVAQHGINTGDLYVLFDADEHTGNFGGIKAFLDKYKNIDTFFIGYPDDKEIMVGARGFLRAEINVSGIAAHSGSSSLAKDNALVKASNLINMISSSKLPKEDHPSFPAGPKVTVTAINGGQGFSQIPDKIIINLDMRLTPSFEKNIASIWLGNIVKNFEGIDISYQDSWPSYALDKDNFAVKQLQEYAQKELNRPVTLRVCGPSNIGNLLASYNIPAICGFGVQSDNIHASNERIKISSINPIYNIYYKTMKSILS